MVGLLSAGEFGLKHFLPKGKGATRAPFVISTSPRSSLLLNLCRTLKFVGRDTLDIY